MICVSRSPPPLRLLPLVAGAVDHRSEQLRYPYAPHKWLAASDRDSPGLYADKDGDETGELSTQSMGLSSWPHLARSCAPRAHARPLLFLALALISHDDSYCGIVSRPSNTPLRLLHRV